MPNVGYATLQIIPSVRGISDELRRQLVGPAGDAGDSAGEAAGGGFKEAFTGALAAIGVAEAASKLGEQFIEAFNQSMEQANVTSTLQAQLGASNSDASKYGASIGRLYAKGVTDSFEQGAEVIRSVVNAGLVDPKATNAQLDSIATKMTDVANTFGTDLSMQTQAVSALMKNGLAKNAGAALDLITTGLQKLGPNAEDLLETFQEYPVQLRKLGLDAQTAMGLFQQGLKGGARDTDIVADALKEFSIRSIDMSTSSRDAYKALGLNAKSMEQQIAKGGSSATAGLQTVLDKLRDIHDPVKQEAAAVGLFGTQAEELGTSLFKLDPSKASKTFSDVGGAADRLGKTLRSGPSYEIEVFKRQLQQGLVTFIGGQVLPVVTTLATGFNTYLLPPIRTVGAALGATLIPALTGLWRAGAAVVTWLKDMGTWLIPIGIAVGGFTAALLAQQIATAGVALVFSVYRGAILAWTAVQRAATIAQAAFNLVMNANPIILVITAIVALGAAMVVAYQKSAAFRAIIQAAWAGIKAGALAVYGWIKDTFVPFFTQTIPNAFRSVVDWVKTNWPWILGFLTGPIGLAVVYILKHWDAVRAGFAAGWSAIKQTVLFPVRDFFTKVIPGWGSAMKQAVVGAWNGEVAGLRNAYGNLKSWVFMPIGTFFTRTIPGWADTLRSRMVGAFDAARAGIKAAWDKIKSIARAPVQYVVDVVYNRGIRSVWNAVAGAFGAPKLDAYHFATGGVLPGYTPGRDVHLAALSGGEAIMRPEWTRAVGPGYVHSMNAAARHGGVRGVQQALGLPGFASGGIFGWIGKGASKLAGYGSDAWEKVKEGASWLKDGIKASALAGLNSVVKPLIKQISGSASLYRSMITAVPAKMIKSILGYSDNADKGLQKAGIGGKGYQAALAWARTQNGKPYQWGGNGDPSWDCSGFMSAIESVIRGQKPHRRWATGAFAGSTAPAGWVRGARSPFMIGITNAGVGHTAGTLNGVNVESRGGDGVIVGSRARGYNASLFTDVYGFKGYANGGSPRPGEVAWVGEHGPELIRFTGGEVVYSNAESKRMAAGLGQMRGFAKGTARAKATAAARKQVPGDVAGFTKSLTGSVSAISAAARELAKDLRAAGGAGKALATSTLKTSARLQALGAKRDAVASRLATARQAAADQRQTAKDYLSVSNLGDAPSVNGLIKQMSQRQAKVRGFQTSIKTLQKKGASQELIRQLVAMGPDSDLARMVSTSGTMQIKQLNALTRSGTNLAASYGNNMADAMYDSGKNASRGFLTGLVSQEKELQAAMDKLGAALVKSIKKKLKIKSPSRVTHALGAYAGQGYALGLDSTASQVAAAASRVSAAAMPAAPGGRVGGIGAGQLTVEVHTKDEALADFVEVRIRDNNGRIMTGLGARPRK
ncbi:phage tail tape measure protein [Streptomyces sp. NPDC029080]|uniref:phage tail tape measure protein n=1 Tax=Streptomyces sp. NPDC029080 TaxID=3155017 RepID=UPI0033D3EC2F